MRYNPDEFPNGWRDWSTFVNYSENRVLYAAKRKGAYTGVFTSPEAAAALSDAAPEELRATAIEGSPCSEKYACVAEGVYTTLRRTEDSFEIDCHDLGPVWGANLQSAIAQLLRASLSQRSLEITALYIYEVDRDYSDRNPENLKERYDWIASSMMKKDILESSILTRDYIGEHFEAKRNAAEYAERCESRYAQEIADLFMRAFVSAKRRRCGFAASRRRDRILRMLCNYYTLDELRIAAVLLRLEQDEEVLARISDGTIPEYRIEDIRERLRKCASGLLPVRERKQE